MTVDKSKIQPEQEGAKAEYVSLRDEILQRIRMRQHIVAGALTIGSVFLGVGLSNPIIAMVYPPLACFLAVAWAQNDFKIRDLSKYIREIIEPVVPGLGWESHMDNMRSEKGAGSWRYVVLAHGGLFLFTQTMALYVGFAWLIWGIAEGENVNLLLAWSLVAIDAISILIVLRVVLRSR